ncbi:MAG: Magnesium and cobalt efflux protein CorC [uncultured Chloroflexi bacterium]|uniref:Magnesium and cobalt efflux protein CorC n=1 Tax=uncultured Chloroflexota bacterium TaxID=166587 RepID=A0A6J4J8N2_9CHLR|nr:MAG: Magnesium and cobalt efflux protein CorC [uncultured Chloroflexota bacterium]
MLFASLLAGLVLLVTPTTLLYIAPEVGGALVVIPLLILALLFAAAETAVAAVRRPRIQQLVDEGAVDAARARHLQRLLENSTGFVAATRLIVISAVIAANTLLVVLLKEPLAAILGNPGAAYVVLTLLVMAIALVLVDQVAHAFGLRHAEAVALGMAGPARTAVLILSPLVSLLEAIGGLVYRQQPGATARSEAGGVTEAGIMLQVDVAEEEGVLEEEEGEMIRSIFEFGDTVAREIMIHRIDLQAAPVTMALGDLVDQAIEAGHSRIPIYEETVDKVLGFFYVKDALRFLREGRLDINVREIMRPAYFVPETKKVDELLREMQQRRVHVAIVVDEYGGTAGLVTIEDILEEIVGEIQDEFDAEESMLVQVSEREALVDAIMTLDDVNDLLSLQLEEEDVDTLGGYVYARLGRVPEQGAEVVDGQVRLVVEEIEGNRITRVRIIRQPTVEEAAAEAEAESDAAAALGDAALNGAPVTPGTPAQPVPADHPVGASTPGNTA